MSHIAYYNEYDKYAAQWLRNLINAGLIAPGVVDERSIEDVTPADLTGFTQCHFFAGIGVWSLALRAAGWPDSRPIWTGSCPCQPFSSAGEGAGFADERHLWPAFHFLIEECRPTDIVGEQVASSFVLPWIDLVHLDLEALGYAFGCIPFPSAGVGAPHIRDRLYWAGTLAHSDHSRLEGRGILSQRGNQRPAGQGVMVGSMADANTQQWGRRSDSGLLTNGAQTGRHQSHGEPESDSQIVRMAHPNKHRFGEGSITELYNHEHNVEPCGITDANGQPCEQGGSIDGRCDQGSHAQPRSGLGGGVMLDIERAGPTNGYWRNADWLGCTDGKWRPVEPGTFPLAAGPGGRVGRVRAGWDAPAGKEGQGHRAGRLKGYGNAINKEAAVAFILAVLD